MDFLEILPQFSKIPGTCPMPTTPTTLTGPLTTNFNFKII